MNKENSNRHINEGLTCKAYFFPVEILSGGKNLILNFMLR